MIVEVPNNSELGFVVRVYDLQPVARCDWIFVECRARKNQSTRKEGQAVS